MNLNTIRLEGKLETEEFFHLADQQGILVMLGWCCCDHWEHWKDWTAEDLTIATPRCARRCCACATIASLLVWLNGSDNRSARQRGARLSGCRVRDALAQPDALFCIGARPRTVTGASGVKMTGPYDYVAPSYWYVDKQNGGAYGFNTETSPGPAIPSLASRQKFLPDADSMAAHRDWSYHYGGGEFTNLKVFDDGDGGRLRQAAIGRRV